MGEIHRSGTFVIQGPNEWGFFWNQLVIPMYSRLMSELGQVIVFWWLIRSRILQLSHSYETYVWRSFSVN